MDTKIEVRSKPILSPTRSLDEGFESDPDRISTDSETLTAPTPSFDLHQRTDRDGVTHTQITRRHIPLEYNGPSSIICLQGEIESEIRQEKESKVSIPRAGTPQQKKQQPQQLQERYRRIKTRAPQPPIGNQRSHSVDGIRPRELSTVDMSGHGDILSGKFVRVTVDPRNQRIMNHTNSMYTFYPAANSMPVYPQQQHHYGLTIKPNKNYQSSNHQTPANWTQSIPRQARR